MISNSNISDGISLIIHTKNEEKNIRECILSAKEVANEIIVIDQSSSDGTVEIAKSLGATVYSIPDKGFVDDYFNFGFGKANYKWILHFAADERLTKSLAKKLLNITKKNECDVVTLPFKNIRFGKWMKHTGFWPDYHPRLFKKGCMKYPGNIKQAHAAPIISGKELILPEKEENAVIHYNARNLEHFLAKFVKYATQEGNTNFFKKNKLTSQVLMDYFEGEFKWRYIDQKGYLDGMHGFVFSKFREYFRFVEFVNWWEREGYPEIFSKEELLETIIGRKRSEENENFQSSKIFKLWRIYHKQKKGFLAKAKLLFNR